MEQTLAYCIDKQYVESCLESELFERANKFGSLVNSAKFATIDNIDEIVYTVNDAYQDDKYGEERFKTRDRTDEAEVREKMETYEKNGGFVLVRDREGFLHSLFFVIVEERSDCRLLSLHMISVLKKFQGMGLGSLLMSLAEKIAKVCDCKKMELWAVNVGLQQIAMYERRNFVCIETIPWPQVYISHIIPEKRSGLYFLVMVKYL
jgi:ribosomal protein S18 acetylase RimI-like enzyme